MSEICSENSETFDVWRTLAATGFKGYMNRVTYASVKSRIGHTGAVCVATLLVPHSPDLVPRGC